MKKIHKTVFFLIMLIAFSAGIFGRGGHSTLDLVDPNFNPRIRSDSYTFKQIFALKVQPDGKILVFGEFTSFNRAPVGKVVRLNSDGSLDSTFDNQTVTSTGGAGVDNTGLALQPDGKILVFNWETVAGGRLPKSVIRLNSNGTLDESFNYSSSAMIRDKAVDSSGRIYLVVDFPSPQNIRTIIRLNSDGSTDNSFQYTAPGSVNELEIVAQGSRLLVNGWFSGVSRRLFRLNENGSNDNSFMAPVPGGNFSQVEVQPDNKILCLREKIYRFNENGDIDASFQLIPFSGNGSWNFSIADDGRIFTTVGFNSRIFRRYLPNGAEDSTFTPYTHPAFFTYVIEPDGNLLIGDSARLSDATIGINNFMRLRTFDSTPDPAFNPGGLGFQTFLPGNIWAIAPQPDGKILLGGKFDEINGVQRSKLARLNADSTIDPGFRINTSGTGNYFSRLDNIYQVRSQSDGKIIVSGSFYYVLNGETRQNFVRLNPDGSIDPSFNLTYSIPDYSEINYAGRNRFEVLSGNKLMIGTSKTHFTQLVGPVRLAESGSLDSTFVSGYNSQAYLLYIDDLAIQPDGKIVISGSHRIDPNAAFKSFVARLNSDGSLDSTFTYSEESGRLRSLLVAQSNGKILVAKHAMDAAVPGRIQRLNADGGLDGTFSSISIPNGIINALLVHPNGKIFAGGKFTIPVNGQTGRNLLQLSENGNFEPTLYNINEEVLSLAADADGRVLVGGGFTVIGANGGNVSRSYVARLTDSNARFDFDGDGKSDLSVFTPENGKWSIRNSGTNQTTEMFFGLSGDRLAAADYDGDDKCDFAVFRPSNGVWYFWRSRDGFAALQWGTAEDKPVAADYDGDGLADAAVWRPSNGVWYVRKSSDGQAIVVQFGLSGDVPLADADFDGDGKADIAVWRPSTGVFYWLASGSGNRFSAFQLGLSGDVPVVGDFNGDGKTDIVVFRPSGGDWYKYLSAANGTYNFSHYNFGLSGDEPVAADYDGDGTTDIAVRRQNVWHIVRSGEGYANSIFAKAGDTAVASSLNR